MYDIVRPYNRWDQNESKVGFFKNSTPILGCWNWNAKWVHWNPNDLNWTQNKNTTGWFSHGSYLLGCRLTMAMAECSAQHQWDSRSILQCWVGKCTIAAVFSTHEKTVSFTKSCKNHTLSMVFWGPRYVVLNSVVISTLAEILSS